MLRRRGRLEVRLFFPAETGEEFTDGEVMETGHAEDENTDGGAGDGGGNGGENAEEKGDGTGTAVGIAADEFLDEEGDGADGEEAKENDGNEEAGDLREGPDEVNNDHANGGEGMNEGPFRPRGLGGGVVNQLGLENFRVRHEEEVSLGRGRGQINPCR